MTTLAQKTCIPCSGGVPALKGDALPGLKSQLHSEWQVMDEHHLERDYQFEDFRQALDFTNQIGEIAEIENHHPDICLGWGKVTVKIYTHKMNGLTESDFILAAKLDEAGN